MLTTRMRRCTAMITLATGLVLAGAVPTQAAERFAPCPTTGHAIKEFGPAPTGFHYGLNIANATGTLIKAGLAGKVTYSGTSGGLGKHLVVTHADATKTVYAHLWKHSVAVGTAVSSSTKVGEMGATGTTDGRAQLHLQVIADGEKINPRQQYKCPQ
ncbi:M23 family metallopeptidase [Streptomyces sp. NPDC088755]|uniref:M23 family metallopeptidase n=1 Tax=Streptomyces sp. NPDC088755 TaxID=3365888 RepID=UPI00381E918E